MAESARVRGPRRARGGAVLARAAAGVVAGACVLVGGAAGPAGAAAAAPAGAAAQEGDGAQGFTFRDDRIVESSGLAASRAHQDVYWTHNDSGYGPQVYAVDGTTGKTVATLTLRGTELRDVEAVSVGPDGDVYVGDIGDNKNGTWPEVWIYRFPEPTTLRDATVTPTRYTVQYADGPRDAESMAVHPKTGRVYIVSKSGAGDGGLYAAPEQLSESGVNTFRRVADIGMRATDAAFSPDGTRLAVRGYGTARMYRWQDGKPARIDRTVPVPLQLQSESVTFTPDGRTLMMGEEGKHTDVQPVGLDGELLPESAEKRGGANGGDTEKGSESGSDNASGDSDGSGGSGDDREVVIGGVTFGIALGIWLLLRSLLRRGRRD